MTSQAGAQPPTPEPSAETSKVDEPPRLPEVIVTAPSRLPGDPLPLSRVPATVDIVPGDRLRGTGAVTLQEALARLPGVNLTDQQGNSWQMDLSFRGFRSSPVTGESQGLSVFVDGVRVNEPTVEEINFDLLPLDDIDRIEVIRGPAAGFGRNTLGGVINIVTRRGAAGYEIVPEIEGGSFGRQKYRLQAGGASGPFDAYVAGSFFKEEGWRDESASRVAKFFGKVGLKYGGTDAVLSYQRADNRIEQPGSLPYPDLRRDPTQNYTGGDFFKPTMNLVNLSVRHSLSPELAVSMTGFGRWLDAEQFNVNQIGANTRSFVGTTSAGGTFQLGYDRAVFGRANHLVVGAEYAHSDVRLRVFEETMGASGLESLISDNQNAGHRGHREGSAATRRSARDDRRRPLGLAPPRHRRSEPAQRSAECIGHQHLQPPQPDDRLQLQPLARLGFLLQLLRGLSGAGVSRAHVLGARLDLPRAPGGRGP